MTGIVSRIHKIAQQRGQKILERRRRQRNADRIPPGCWKVPRGVVYEDLRPVAKPDAEEKREPPRLAACPICLNDEVCVWQLKALYPCGHLICTRCTRKLPSKRGKRACPVCREYVKRDLTLYPQKGVRVQILSRDQ